METKGLDISYFNSGVDFDDIQEKGYEFLIIRGGYTGSRASKKQAKDKSFDNFYNQAKERNIPVGCYFFSRATCAAEGEKEAEWLYNNCLKGRQFEYPIMMDIEDEEYQAKATSEQNTEAAVAFCEYLENKGYYVGWYANPTWIKNHLIYEDLKDYDLWLAHWVKKPTQKYTYGMWQCSGSKNGAVIKGSKEKVDRDVAFKNYPRIMKKNGLNGYEKQETNDVSERESVCEIKVGDYVEILEKGNTRADGSGRTSSENVIGWTRVVVAITKYEFKYLLAKVENGVVSYTGYFKPESIKRIEKEG